MKREFEFDKKAFWFKQEGPEQDVVISSRARLGRNLVGFSFPFQMTRDEEEKSKARVLEALALVRDPAPLSVYQVDAMSALERKLLLERNIISQEFSLLQNKALGLNDDGSLSLLVNESDHVKLVALRSGYDLGRAFADVDALDTRLEEHLEYAVSLEWGYLSPYLANIGTQVRVSFMLHLPALVFTSLINKAVKTIASFGLMIKGFFSDTEESLGDIYQVSNQIAIGMTEKEIMANLEEIVLQIVQYERRAREEMLEREPITVKDKVFRALGTLLYARSLGSREAMGHLSLVRLGLSLGLLKGIPLENVTALLFLCQKYHIQSLLDNIDEIDSKLIDYTRAKLIRESLEGIETPGGE
jgi:protein arginine kinase